MEAILVVVLVSVVVSACVCMLFVVMLRNKLDEYLGLVNRSVRNCSRYFEAIKNRYPKNRT